MRSYLEIRNKHITILKVDIEGEEMWSIPQVLQTELLRHIKQIHTSE